MFEHLEEEIEHEVQPWKTGSAYEGGHKDGMRHGTGRIRYDNGDLYKGGFQEDKRHGMGVMLFKDGRLYKGNWVQD